MKRYRGVFYSAHMSQAFFRLDADRQRSTGSAGSGLYLCRLVAQAHGGELVLENANPGSRARLQLQIAI
jgi:signal transduction histidine kinase